MKVLFLDMDGVILSRQDLTRAHEGDLWVPINSWCPPEKIALLNAVCLSTKCFVVMSSTWRFDDGCRENMVDQGFRGQFHEDWRTMRWPPKPSMEMRRGAEIQEWLGRHQEVTRYAIVDDDTDMLPYQRPHFVQTPHETGMSDDHAAALIGLLGCDRIEDYVSPYAFEGVRVKTPEEAARHLERVARARARMEARKAGRLSL